MEQQQIQMVVEEEALVQTVLMLQLLLEELQELDPLLHPFLL